MAMFASEGVNDDVPEIGATRHVDLDVIEAAFKRLWTQLHANGGASQERLNRDLKAALEVTPSHEAGRLQRT